MTGRPTAIAETRRRLLDDETGIPDRAYSRKAFGLAGKILRTVFRVRVTGLENLDLSRPAILVANHNLGMWGMIELFGPAYAWYCLQEDPPDLVPQGGDVLYKLPYGKRFAQGTGIALATLDGMRNALENDRWVITAPGALVDQYRPFWLRNRPRLQRASWIANKRVLTDQLAYAHIAAEGGFPIYPVAVSGTVEMTPVLFESQQVLRWSGIGRFFRKDEHWPSFPITLNHFINLLVFLCTPLASSPLAWALFVAANVYIDWVYTYPIFPFQVRVQFGEPISSPKDPSTNGDSLASLRVAKEVHAKVVDELGRMLDSLDDGRPLPQLVRFLRKLFSSGHGHPSENSEIPRFRWRPKDRREL